MMSMFNSVYRVLAALGLDKIDSKIGAFFNTRALVDLSDVAAVRSGGAAKAVGDQLLWSGTEWQPSPAGVGGATTLDALADVVVATPISGTLLGYQGAPTNAWIGRKIAGFTSSQSSTGIINTTPTEGVAGQAFTNVSLLFLPPNLVGVESYQNNAVKAIISANLSGNPNHHAVALGDLGAAVIASSAPQSLAINTTAAFFSSGRGGVASPGYNKQVESATSEGPISAGIGFFEAAGAPSMGFQHYADPAFWGGGTTEYPAAYTGQTPVGMSWANNDNRDSVFHLTVNGNLDPVQFYKTQATSMDGFQCFEEIPSNCGLPLDQTMRPGMVCFFTATALSRATTVADGIGGGTGFRSGVMGATVGTGAGLYVLTRVSATSLRWEKLH